jgi:monofunctional glycosyltransferase
MKKKFAKVWSFVWKSTLAFFIITIVATLLFRFINPFMTFTMLTRKTEALFEKDKSSKVHYRWRDYDEISPYMPLAIITAEDQKFPYHHGFDFQAIEKAIDHNEKVAKKKRKRIKGASTISQQVAKNLFLWQGRSYVRKGFEVYFTVLIEVLWSKQRIIEMYMNIVEMGDMTFGVEAAAQRYFKKPAAKLSQYEAAAIAVILPNPRKYKAANPGPYVQNRINWCVNMMDKLGGKGFLKEIE